MATKRKAKKKKQRHSCDGNLCYHGAFKSQSAAEQKKSELGKKAFVRRKFARWGNGPMLTRWLVLTKDTSGVPF